ncbi:MAG TPA: hypothetical protein VD978_37105 [Azospirillum sp.]|nr:hypothetical protein [Azospirillum sp.]
MGETDHIAEQAELAASELFSEFFWEKTGPTNQNWPCEDKDRHDVETHPCDVVYYYDEPYAAVRTYVHCDLKSYAKGSISTAAMKSALISLAKQVSCADRSSVWRDRHVLSKPNASIVGLLFVYNHDGEYDKDFQTTIADIRSEMLDIPKGSRVYVLGPKEIYWLDNVADDIKRMRGKKKPEIPSQELCSYFYPQPVRRANVQSVSAKAASLEMLTSPIIMMQYRMSPSSAHRGIVLFYSRKGETPEEFMYLIDLLRKYNLLDQYTSITVKTLNASSNAPPNFEKAQQQYVERLPGGDKNAELSGFVKDIKYESMSKVKTTFSTVELGMQR